LVSRASSKPEILLGPLLIAANSNARLDSDLEPGTLIVPDVGDCARIACQTMASA